LHRFALGFEMRQIDRCHDLVEHADLLLAVLSPAREGPHIDRAFDFECH
jgi:hypothetical protein